MPSPHPYNYEQMREPVYRDDYDEDRHRYPPAPERQRTHRRREYEPEERRPRRRRSHQDLRAPSSASSSESPPPPRRYHSRREPRPRDYEAYDPYEERYGSSRPQHPGRYRRDDGYVSDNRYNRPRRDIYDDHRRGEDAYEYMPRSREQRHRGDPHMERERERERVHGDRRRDDRYRDGAPRGRPKPPQRSGSRWQKEAKNMFVEYAVPVIKAEGGKYMAKQLGNFIAKK